MEIDKQLFLVYLFCFVLFWLEAKTPFWRLFTTARQRGVRMRQEDWWELQSVMWWVVHVHRKHDRRETGSRIKTEHAICCVIVSKDVCVWERKCWLGQNGFVILGSLGCYESGWRSLIPEGSPLKECCVRDPDLMLPTCFPHLIF